VAGSFDDAPFQTVTYSVTQPYPVDIVSCSKSGLICACHKWLSSLGAFEAPSHRINIAGCQGTFKEHLARIVSFGLRHPVDWRESDVWWLLLKRAAARAWSDDNTVRTFDRMIYPHIFIELLAAEEILFHQPERTGVHGALMEWWIEGPPGDRDCVRTIGPVTYAVRRRVGDHLGVPPGNIIPRIVDFRGAPWCANMVDQPAQGEYSVKVIFGGSAADKELTNL
jgi:hypothetical protein